MPKVADAIIMYVPERWGEIDRFKAFWSTTHKFGNRERRAISGAQAHFMKALRLRSIAERILPNLNLDRAELEQRGFTSAEHGQELATVMEAALVELYSSIDCTAHLLHAIYGQSSQNFRQSTRGLFERINKISGAFPETLKELIRDAGWYSRLRVLRDELTHLATGSCSLNHENGLVTYMHSGLQEDGRALIIDDFPGWFDAQVGAVNQFLGAIFNYLNSQLADEPVFQMCGMTKGRVLHRYIRPSDERNFNGGACGAYAWFELPENPTCPFTESCGAYQRRHPPQGWETSNDT